MGNLNIRSTLLKKDYKSIYTALCLLITSCNLPVKNVDTNSYRKNADSLTTSLLSNQKDTGFRGIWYSIGNTGDEYKVKYGGGLATYPSNHYPFSVYVSKVEKTYFCYGGTDAAGKTLLHEVSFYDHKTGMVSRPTIVLDKKTNDAHDNPVIQVDKKGYIWLFSTSHGVQRPSYISRSVKPYDISKFQIVDATKVQNGKKVPLDNFSYLQIYYTNKSGFIGLFTHYLTKDLRYGKKNCRITAYMTSKDGVNWSEWKDLANIEEGQYQTSGKWNGKIGTAFNCHPNVKTGSGLDYRTNLYYMYTDDNGVSWKTADNKELTIPLKSINNPALIKDYASEGKTVYINDVNFDKNGNPVILYLTSEGPDPGPKNGMKDWFIAKWNGSKWLVLPVTSSDHNYDMGSLYIETKGKWTIIAPVANSPQKYNTGGEMTVLTSNDEGLSWKIAEQLTSNSTHNHSYPRRPVNADKGFFAFWADGNGRSPSKSHLYFSTNDGAVYQLPESMNQDLMKPLKIR